ncbi:MAG: hypothetical protein KAU28_04025, partial [Phycisphaerae bacterium]|nr:hypothetical protein [Phycisphaerae bacterium]
MLEFLTSQKIVGPLGAVDLLILTLSVAALFVIAYIAGRKEADTRDFFLGNRKIPGIVVCLSFVATEVSAVTIVAVPTAGFSENLEYLQFFVGSAAARIFVAFLFLPLFFKYACTSIYEFLRHRFGPATQYAGAIFFFITRLIASGIRLYAACMAVAFIMGWSLGQAILVFSAVSIVFIAFGGIKAVVWNGAYQAIMFYIAGGAVAAYLLSQIQGGLPAVWEIAGSAGRLSVFKFDLNFNDPTTFWAGSTNAFFIGLVVFGTDQELVQRLLTVKTQRSSQRAIVSTILAALPITCLYLALGTLLFVFYHQHPGLGQPAPKEVLSNFVVGSLPMGLKGLMLSAIILA